MTTILTFRERNGVESVWLWGREGMWVSTCPTGEWDPGHGTDWSVQSDHRTVLESALGKQHLMPAFYLCLYLWPAGNLLIFWLLDSWPDESEISWIWISCWSWSKLFLRLLSALAFGIYDFSMWWISKWRTKNNKRDFAVELKTYVESVNSAIETQMGMLYLIFH